MIIALEVFVLLTVLSVDRAGLEGEKKLLDELEEVDGFDPELWQ